MKGTLVSSALLCLFVANLLWVASQYPRDVRLVPMVIGIPTLFLFFILLLGEFYPTLMSWMESTLQDLWGGKAAGADVEVAPSEMTPWSSVIRVMAWGTGFFVLVFFLGYFVVPPFFVAAFLVKEAEVRPLNAIFISLGLCIALFGGLTLLRIDLWVGAIPEIIPGYLGGGIIPPL